MRIFLIVLMFMLLHTIGKAQDKLFAPSVLPEPRVGFIITGSGSLDVPGADMANRYGTGYRIGFGLMHKSKKNWIIGGKFDFIVGETVNDDSLMINIRDKYSGSFNGKLVEFIGSDGYRIGVPVYERGFATGIEIGKIFSISKYRPDNGFMLLSTVGFIEHYIDIFDKDNAVPQIRGDYSKGYDRLTTGLFYEQYAGFVYFSKSRLVNFHIGLDALFGVTQGRRGYQYDLMRADNAQRLDILFGIRGGWYIPIFKRKSEDIMFQ
jgi:hypothetical protein